MKKLLYSAILILTFSSCSKTEESPAVVVPKGNFFARVINKDWSAVESFAFIDSDNQLYITGTSKDKIELNIQLISSDTGLYRADAFTTNNFVTLTDSSIYTMPRAYDSDVDPVYQNFVRITKIDTTTGIIQGTFEVVLSNLNDKRLIAVEDGEFKIPFLKIPFSDSLRVPHKQVFERINY